MKRTDTSTSRSSNGVDSMRCGEGVRLWQHRWTLRWRRNLFSVTQTSKRRRRITSSPFQRMQYAPRRKSTLFFRTRIICQTEIRMMLKIYCTSHCTNRCTKGDQLSPNTHILPSEASRILLKIDHTHSSSWPVAPNVEGSNPFSHPNLNEKDR